MGKVAGTSKYCTTTRNSNNNGTDDSDDENFARLSLRRDLEEVRRNALAAKRKMQIKASRGKAKSSFQKCLSKFASNRRDIEDAVQSKNSLILTGPRMFEDKKLGNISVSSGSGNNSSNQNNFSKNPRIISDQILQKPLNLKGFFRAGIKGKETKRPLTINNKFKEAVLKGDALQVFQSGNFLRLENSKKPANDSDSLAKMEFSKVQVFSDSSDTDELADKNDKSSPIFNGAKSLKKKKNLKNVNGNQALKIAPFQKNQSPIISHSTKEDKCKRRLFKEENPNQNNGNSKNNNDNQYNSNDVIRYSQRKSTPENVIFFTEHIPSQNVDNKSRRSNNKLSPSDPKLIKYYVQICTEIAQNNFKDFLSNNVEDPLKIVKSSLKSRFSHSFKDFLNRQKNTKEKYNSVDQCTESSGSEIMIEPDSAIARTLKKNRRLQILKTTERYASINKSSSSSDYNDKESNLPRIQSVEKQVLKRKYVPSSKSSHSECTDLEVPSSIKVNFNPNSEKRTMKMDAIHPDRQELIARYLNDAECNSQHEINRNNVDIKRTDLNVKKTVFVHKSTKHIPAILRKNRSDFITEEKNIYSIEEGPERTEVAKKMLVRDINTNLDDMISERTPNCTNLISSPLIEAPKCKHTYMNAKYNPPPRVSESNYVRRVQRKVSSQKMHVFPTPSIITKNFDRTQSFNKSPIEKQLSFSDSSMNDFQMFQLSQGSSTEIQERTNQLTLQSSQNCSQDSVNQMLPTSKNHYSSHSDYYHRVLPCNSQLTVYNRAPPSQTFNVTLNPNSNYHLQNMSTYKELHQPYISPNYQIPRSEACSFQNTNNYSYCVIPNCQTCGNHLSQSSQQYQDPRMLCVPVQQQNGRQPVKFMAIEGNRLPQRRPIYNLEDTNSCSYTHKVSIPNHQYNQTMQPYYHSNAGKQPPYSLSSLPSHSQEVYPYDNIHRQSNLVNEEFSGSRRNVVNFVPNNMSNQNFVPQQGVPMHRNIHSQRYLQSMQILPPTCTQVSYQQSNHSNSNEIYDNVNDIYLQEMNHNVQSKRS